MSDMTVADLIKQHEGLRLKPYTDTLGKLTIGYGRCLSTEGITTAEAESLFQNDLAECRRDIATLFGPLNEAREAALIDMRFNLGFVGIREFHHMITAIEEQRWDAAADAAQDSKWAAQVPLRAETLIRMLRTGQWS